MVAKLTEGSTEFNKNNYADVYMVAKNNGVYVYIEVTDDKVVSAGKNYFEGEKFSHEGMRVKVYYENADEEEVNNNDLEIKNIINTVNIESNYNILLKTLEDLASINKTIR